MHLFHITFRCHGRGIWSRMLAFPRSRTHTNGSCLDWTWLWFFASNHWQAITEATLCFPYFTASHRLSHPLRCKSIRQADKFIATKPTLKDQLSSPTSTILSAPGCQQSANHNHRVQSESPHQLAKHTLTPPHHHRPTTHVPHPHNHPHPLPPQARSSPPLRLPRPPLLRLQPHPNLDMLRRHALSEVLGQHQDRLRRDAGGAGVD